MTSSATNRDPRLSRMPSRATLSDDVYELVKARVMDHELKPSSRVNIDALSREMNVSPTPLREALARLESDGLVVKESLRGYFVAPLISREDFESLFEFRLLIEPWAAAHAAERIDERGRAALVEELAACSEIPAEDIYDAYGAVAAHDHRFHLLVAQLSGNAQLPAAFERTNCHVHIFRLFYQRYVGAAALEEHTRIAEAIATGAPSAARKAMRDHLIASRARLRAVFDQTAP
jgi:DNA-binding GntR family transcriptional regulator